MSRHWRTARCEKKIRKNRSARGSESTRRGDQPRTRLNFLVSPLLLAFFRLCKHFGKGTVQKSLAYLPGVRVRESWEGGFEVSFPKVSNGGRERARSPSGGEVKEVQGCEIRYPNANNNSRSESSKRERAYPKISSLRFGSKFLP